MNPYDDDPTWHHSTIVGEIDSLLARLGDSPLAAVIRQMRSFADEFVLRRAELVDNDRRWAAAHYAYESTAGSTEKRRKAALDALGFYPEAVRQRGREDLYLKVARAWSTLRFPTSPPAVDRDEIQATLDAMTEATGKLRPGGESVIALDRKPAKATAKLRNEERAIALDGCGQYFSGTASELIQRFGDPKCPWGCRPRPSALREEGIVELCVSGETSPDEAVFLTALWFGWDRDSESAIRELRSVRSRLREEAQIQRGWADRCEAGSTSAEWSLARARELDELAAGMDNIPRGERVR